MGGYYYTTKAGDMWDYIAWKVYGDEFKIDILMSAPENANQLKTTIFSDGVQVWCPKIEEETESDDLPPWRDTE